MNNIYEWLKERKAPILRGAFMLLGLINAILAMYGKSPLPISETDITNLFSALWVMISALWAYWKNNSFTVEAIEADKVLKEYKKEGVK